MKVDFATCDPKRALQFIKKVYPSITIEEGCAEVKSFLSLVSRDIVRLQDPYMHGNRIQVIEGKKKTDQDMGEIKNCLINLQAYIKKLLENKTF